VLVPLLTIGIPTVERRDQRPHELPVLLEQLRPRLQVEDLERGDEDGRRRRGTASILVFATLGTSSISGSVTEVMIMYAIGVLGFFMRRFDFPVAPVILGVILGPLMEAQFRRTLLVSDGDFGAFLDRPFAVVLFGLAFAALVVPATVGAVQRIRGLGDED
jgi:hypothetical protein